jgi:hypothetical protein
MLWHHAVFNILKSAFRNRHSAFRWANFFMGDVIIHMPRRGTETLSTSEAQEAPRKDASWQFPI